MNIDEMKDGLNILSDEEVPTFTHEIECLRLNNKDMCVVVDPVKEHEEIYDKLLDRTEYTFCVRVCSFISHDIRKINLGMYLSVKINENELVYTIKISPQMIEFLLNSDRLFIVAKTKRPMFLINIEPLKDEFLDCYRAALEREYMLRAIYDEMEGDKDNG